MDQLEHLSIFRKTGKALIAVGLIDIAAMIYCVATGVSYSSSLNIFAVIAGFFLLRGSLRAAGFVRWFSMFLLAGACGLALSWPLAQPLSLTLVQVRLNPLATAVSIALLVAVITFLFWVQRQLGQPPVLSALRAAGRKVRDMRAAAAVGFGIVVLLAAVIPLALSGESGTKAKAMAQEQLGASYRYHVSSLNVSTSSQGKFVRATVAAWNEREVRTVPVQWKE
jgi:hypothetical protein